MKFNGSKYKLLKVLTVIVLVFSILYVSYRGDTKLSHLSNVYSIVSTPFLEISSYVKKITANINFFYGDKANELVKENDYLRKKVDQLERDNLELNEYRQKIGELRSALNIKEQYSDYNFQGANVIAKDASNWFNIFTVDVGSKDGVRKNDPVITSRGLVGRVISVDVFSSKIISLIDPNSTVSSRISRTRELSRVRGDITLKDRGQCKLDYIPNDTELNVGDRIETSGLGGIYPKGILVGRIVEVKQSSNEFKKYAVIEPVVDFEKLEEVFILKSKK